MEAKNLWLGTWVGILIGCVATPSGPPEEVAPRIAAELDAGRSGEAEDLFEASASEEGATAKLYPLLYDAARERYEKGEYARSARVLSFMSDRYPKALAVREALVYALFLERARAESAAPELAKELDAAVAKLRVAGSPAPPWLELVDAQLAIDRGEFGPARERLAGFRAAWDGEPHELVVYVEDIDRYLESKR